MGACAQPIAIERYTTKDSRLEGIQEVAKDENKPIHDIHYLPAINQSPTKFDTVQEMLV